MKWIAEIALAALLVVPTLASAFEGPELYPGEAALYEAAAKEGMIVSFDTGPTWANWGTMFKRFKKRYPEVEMVYNDLGSAVTVVTLDKAQLAAAESLGAGRLRALADILIPQILPTALAAYCLVAAVAIGAYGTALALVGTQVNILPLLLFSKISETGSDFPAAAALSLILLAICSLIMATAELFSASRS